MKPLTIRALQEELEGALALPAEHTLKLHPHSPVVVVNHRGRPEPRPVISAQVVQVDGKPALGVAIYQYGPPEVSQR